MTAHIDALATAVLAEFNGAALTFASFDRALDVQAPSAPGHIRREVFEQLPEQLQQTAWRALRVATEASR